MYVVTSTTHGSGRACMEQLARQGEACRRDHAALNGRDAVRAAAWSVRALRP